jgi:hypothetical protein
MIRPLELEWREITKGMVLKGKVVRLEKFGVFVDIGAERPGLVHISEMTHGYIKSPSDVVKEGDEVVPWNIEENGVISGPEEFDRFPWEEAAKLDFSKFYEIQPFLPQGMKILACSGKVFTVTWMLMGFQNFCLSLYVQEELVSKVFRILSERNVEVDCQTWNRRYREYMEKIKSGSVYEVAEVLGTFFI